MEPREEILGELLQRSIRPTLDRAEKIEILGTQTDASPEVLLYLLVILDVRTLAAAPRNAGVLTRLPEVVIGIRTQGYRITESIEAIVAASCLRVCLADQACIDAAAGRATDLIDVVE